MPGKNSFPGFNPPAASTEAPLEMLSACHGRIETQCAALERLLDHLALHGADADAQSAALKIMRYFDSAAIDHHADEEADLFPALLESMAGSDPVCLREMTAGLCNEHRQLERLWAVVRALLQGVVDGTAGKIAAADREAIETLVVLYRRHIEREERELLPMAARLLGEAELAAVGMAMRRRRGLDQTAHSRKKTR